MFKAITYTVCPGSSDPFYIVTYYKKYGSLLPGHTVVESLFATFISHFYTEL